MRLARGILLLLAALYFLSQPSYCQHADFRQEISPLANATLTKLFRAFETGSKLEISSFAITNDEWTGFKTSKSLNSHEGVNQTSTDALNPLHSVWNSILGQALKIGLEHPYDEALRIGIKRHQEEEIEGLDFREQNSEDLAFEEVPGITAAVYQDFFTKASAVAVQLLEENFKKVKLDSVTAVAQVPVIGPFNIKLENVKLEGLKLDQTSTGVSLGDDGTFSLVISNLDAIVNGHFQWKRTKFPFISGGCQAQVTAVNGNVRLKVTVVGDKEGRPKVADINAAELSFDSLRIVTYGAKLSWLYNAVAAFAHTQIQEAITKAVSQQVSTTVPGQINHLLEGVPTIVHIKGLDLNTSLAKSPEVDPDRLVVWDWGRFQNPNHEFQDCPFVRQINLQGPHKPILPGGSPYQIIADIDESIINCLTWDMFKKGKLHALLQGDDLPEKALYTDSWRLVIPAVYIKCPSCPMAVNATVTKTPSTKIHGSKGIVTQGSAELSFFLVEDSRSSIPWTPIGTSSQKHLLSHTNEYGRTEDIVREGSESQKGELSQEEISAQNHNQKWSLGDHLFTLSLSGELAVHNLSLDEDPAKNGWRLNLAMKINQSALEVGVVESDVGKINEAALHFALTVASFLVEDKVNHGILADGFPLPNIPHVKVDRANVTVVKHALALGADFSYQP